MKTAALLALALSSLLVSAAPTRLDKRDTYGSTSNELGTCRKVLVIFSRGTTEAGNIGTAGPPFFDDLSTVLGSKNLGVQGVNYPANIAGFLAGGDAGGAATLASLANQAASQYPSIQLVLSGYSQGAQVVHNGAPQLSASTKSKVKAIVLFGDTDDNQPFLGYSSSIVKTFCAAGDTICAGTDIITAAHLSYGSNAAQATSFVKCKVSV